jgi:phosphotriesterase-related protein
MKMINTVLGPISPDKLGFTLVHEHFCVQYPGLSADATMFPYDPKPVREKALKVLSSLKAAGVNTFVDCTPNDMTGRDPELFKELSKKTGINIICATGLYFESEGMPKYWKNRQMFEYDIVDEIYQMFKTEVTKGIGKTGVKAGVIKVAASQEAITDYEKDVHKAAAMAQKETGVPIMTHLTGPTLGPEQADLLLEAGANPHQLAIGHMNNSEDMSYYLEVLKRPYIYASFDRTSLGPQEKQITFAKSIAELIKKGYLKRILISADSVLTWAGRPFKFPDYVGNFLSLWSPMYIPGDFCRLLKAEGVTDEQFRVMMVENPKRLYTGE